MSDPVLPAMHWQVNPDGCRVGPDGLTRGMAVVGFHAEGTLDGVAAVARDFVAELVTTPLAGRVAGLDSVRRYGQLLREAEAVRRELHVLDAGLRRVDGTRTELLAAAAPGFSTRLAELDAERGDLARRSAEAAARLTALDGPLSVGAAAARRDAEARRVDMNGDAARALMARKHELAARLGEAASSALTALLAVSGALHSCSVGSHGMDVLQRLDEFAVAAASGGSCQQDRVGVRGG